jgi:hypothetical protein
MQHNFSSNKLDVLQSYYYPKTGSRFEIFNEMYLDEIQEKEIESISDVKKDKPKTKSKKYK